MSPVTTAPGTHFSEIFAKELEFELICYSRAGMSNAGIALQLASAMRQKADLIIFNTTAFDRIEVPVKNSGLGIMNDLTDYSTYYKVYDVQNLLYTQAEGLSLQNAWANKDPKIWSISLADFLTLDPKKHKHNNAMCNLEKIQDLPEKIEAANNWFKFIYDENVKKMVDSCVMYALIHQLYTFNVPHIWVNDCLISKGHPLHMNWLKPKYNVTGSIGKLFKDPNLIMKHDVGYHTTKERQKEIANALIEHYKIYF